MYRSQKMGGMASPALIAERPFEMTFAGTLDALAIEACTTSGLSPAKKASVDKREGEGSGSSGAFNMSILFWRS